MAIQLPITLPPLPMPHNRAKAACDLLVGAGFFPILQQGINLGHVAIGRAAGISVESKGGEWGIEAVNWCVAEELSP